MSTDEVSRIKELETVMAERTPLCGDGTCFGCKRQVDTLTGFHCLQCDMWYCRGCMVPHIGDDARCASMAMTKALGAAETRAERAEAALAEANAKLDRHGRIVKTAQGLLSATVLEEARQKARAQALEEAAAVAENEPELEGPMPEEIRRLAEKVRRDYGEAELHRAVCRGTKKSIAAAIRALAAQPEAAAPAEGETK